MYRYCIACDDQFWADEPWKRKCLPCWKRTRQEEFRSAFDGAFGQRRHPPPPQPPPRPAPPPRPLIEPDMLKRLIYLCHPDKHNNSTAAKLATEWLLKQRKNE